MQYQKVYKKTKLGLLQICNIKLLNSISIKTVPQGLSMKKIFFIFFIVIYLTAPGIGQNGQKNVSKAGTSAGSFLRIPVGAQAIGMGGAYVSLVNDATALYWNVAGIAGQNQNEFIGVHSDWIAGVSFDFAALVISLQEFGSIGFNITSLSMDDMKVRTVEKPEGTGEFFEAGDLAIALSYARFLSDRFAIGFTAKYIQQKIWHMKAGAFAIDMGTTFKTDLFSGMIIGASISNFGSSMQLSGRDTRRFSRIDETKLGSNERIPQNIEMDSWDLPLVIQFGLSTRAYYDENFSWTVAVDAVNPSDNYKSVNVGTELMYRDFLFFRTGYSALFLDDAEGGLSFGVGLKSASILTQAVIDFDYAFRDMGRLQEVHTFSIGVIF